MNLPLSHIRPVPRRGLSRDETAMYVGISAGKFDEMVADGRMPSPIHIDEFTVWDIEKLALAMTYPTGLVYVVGFGGYVKIGFTTNLKSRLATLQSGMPEKIIVYGTIPQVDSFREQELHERFRAYRLEGEWFRKEGELAAWIEAGCPL